MRQRELRKTAGRPREKEWPDAIPDTPENVLQAVLKTPSKPPKGWRYLKPRPKKKG